MIDWRSRLRAAGIHLGISLVVAALAAVLVFVVWYPYPYREISGGRELFKLVVAVDVVLGPLITLCIFNRAKPRAELRRDLAIVGLIQLVGLCYGLWTVFLARPVHLVFEYDRFRVVHAIDVPTESIPRAPSAIVAMPLTGPTVIAARPFASEAERMEATFAALGGAHPSMRPEFWQPYADAADRLKAAGKPVAALKARFPARASEIDEALAHAGLTPDKTLWIPMSGRDVFWTVLIDAATAQPLVFLPLDSF